jgi:hypothetical protein
MTVGLDEGEKAALVELLKRTIGPHSALNRRRARLCRCGRYSELLTGGFNRRAVAGAMTPRVFFLGELHLVTALQTAVTALKAVKRTPAEAAALAQVALWKIDQLVQFDPD